MPAGRNHATLAFIPGSRVGKLDEFRAEALVIVMYVSGVLWLMDVIFIVVMIPIVRLHGTEIPVKLYDDWPWNTTPNTYSLLTISIHNDSFSTPQWAGFLRLGIQPLLLQLDATEYENAFYLEIAEVRLSVGAAPLDKYISTTTCGSLPYDNRQHKMELLICIGHRLRGDADGAILIHFALHLNFNQPYIYIRQCRVHLRIIGNHRSV